MEHKETDTNGDEDLNAVLQRFSTAQTRRGNWESLWQEAYDFTLPQRNTFDRFRNTGQRRNDNIYDGTALDAVEQLAASLLGDLTPPWTQWFGLKPGPDLTAAESESLAPVLENAAKTIQAHFDRSNFIVEIHQTYLDLIVGGTAALAVEEADPGRPSAFRFSAVPLGHITLEEDENGLLSGSFRTLNLTLTGLRERYPLAALPPQIVQEGEKNTQHRFEVLESILPEAPGGFSFRAFLTDRNRQGRPRLLRAAKLPESPLIAYRWLKSPGEIYGRSPVMKALPDIKTANKVVELVLKNASIAVTGIWQADDDGVLNPANIELKPGSIIPKAVGSQGLSPLDMPGRFDISQLVLEDLRGRIRHALMTDRLGPVSGGPRMTATEVLERSAEMALLLGATYGRLQSELMTPLIVRAFNILRRRGEVPDVTVDGRFVEIDYRAPLARAQGQRNVQNTLFWIDSVLGMGGDAPEAVNRPEAARFLGEALGVPSDLIRNELPPLNLDTPPSKETENADQQPDQNTDPQTSDGNETA